MSARFGRNKKRAMQTEIARYKTAYDITNQLAIAKTKRVIQLELEIADAIRIAGEMSILFPTKQIKLESLDESHSFDVAMRRDAPGIVNDEYDKVTLQLMLSHIDKDSFNKNIHAKVTYGNKISALAINQDALQVLPKDILAKRIIDILANDLCEQLKGIS